MDRKRARSSSPDVKARKSQRTAGSFRTPGTHRHMGFLRIAPVLNTVLSFVDLRKTEHNLVRCTGSVWSLFCQNRDVLQKHTHRIVLAGLNEFAARFPCVEKLEITTRSWKSAESVRRVVCPAVKDLDFSCLARDMRHDGPDLISAMFPNLVKLTMTVGNAVDLFVSAPPRGCASVFEHLDHLSVSGPVKHVRINKPLKTLALSPDHDTTVQVSMPAANGRLAEVDTFELLPQRTGGYPLNQRICFWGPVPRRIATHHSIEVTKDVLDDLISIGHRFDAYIRMYSTGSISPTTFVDCLMENADVYFQLGHGPSIRAALRSDEVILQYPSEHAFQRAMENNAFSDAFVDALDDFNRQDARHFWIRIGESPVARRLVLCTRLTGETQDDREMANYRLVPSRTFEPCPI